MATFDEYKNFDAMGLAKLVKEKQVSPEELLDTAIEILEVENPKINSIAIKMFDEARDSIKSGLPDGPFKGVPFLLKEYDTYKGIPTTFASKFMENNIPNIDSELVSRYKKAGFVIIGKTNAPEFGIGGTTESTFYGPSRNPFDNHCSSGGSSGGSAASIAAGIVPAANGSDAGGSIRMPASSCGIIGLKPTRGRVPMGPLKSEGRGGLSVSNVMSRSLRDTAAILDLISGPDVGAAYWPELPNKPYLQELRSPEKPLRIAYSIKNIWDVNSDIECIDAVMNTVKKLESFGHEIIPDPIKIDSEKYTQATIDLIAGDLCHKIEMYGKKKKVTPLPDFFDDHIWSTYQYGLKLSALDYVNALHNIQNIGRKVAYGFENIDIYITPVMSKPPLKIGELFEHVNDVQKFYLNMWKYQTGFTGLFNASGNPAISLPLHRTSNGLPVGVQLVSKYSREDTLFQVSQSLLNE
ncbi:MAG: amidase [Planctomycetota bacterium]|nr:MAG: amidase [Planctomycetota bacterium]